MTAYTNFINTITFMPNPWQNLDRSYADSLPLNAPNGLSGGNPANGAQLFQTLIVNGKNTCNDCHTASNGLGSSLQILLLGMGQIPEENQPLKVTLLRETYQKLLFIKNSANGQTIDGFGLTHDGTADTLIDFLAKTFPNLSGQAQNILDIAAYNLSFDTGMAPSVGFAHTLDATSVTISQITADWATLESQAAAGNCDLIAEGTVHGVISELLYQPAQGKYLSTTGAAYTHAQILTLVSRNDILTVMGVPHGSGSRYAFSSRVAPRFRGSGANAGA
jgi:hypothetical protein